VRRVSDWLIQTRTHEDERGATDAWLGTHKGLLDCLACPLHPAITEPHMATEHTKRAATPDLRQPQLIRQVCGGVHA